MGDQSKLQPEAKRRCRGSVGLLVALAVAAVACIAVAVGVGVWARGEGMQCLTPGLAPCHV